jgi:hypothetical protein
VNWSDAEECKRCRAPFEGQDDWEPNELRGQNYESLAPEPTRIFSGGVKLLTGILAVEVVAILLAQIHLLDGDVAKVIAAAFVIAGFALLLVTHVWLVVRILQESVWWGVGTLFIPLVGLIAVIQFWQKTKRSFVGQMICSGIFFGGLLIMPN